ncbi:MAG: GldG family protein [Bryobacterales bacterium]|nr:GldG family protein [Bryobacterales bacterium]
MPTGNGSILDRYWRESRQNRYGVYLVVYVVVVLLLLGGVNYLTNRFNKSYDSTATHRLTLSDQSRKVAEALPGDISMRYFYSTGGAEPAKELLSRYAELSGKIHVDYVDMDQKPLEARAAGVTAAGEVVLSMGPRLERASMLSEEEITRAMIRLTREGSRTVCVMQGSGEPSLETREADGFSNLPVLLKASSYEIRPVNLADATAALQSTATPQANAEQPTCSVLIVAGPRTDYPSPVVAAIRNYVEAGNAALFLLDPPGVVQGLSTAANDELAKLLAGWGVELQKNWLIAPRDLASLRFGPLTIAVTGYDSHPITSTLGSNLTLFPEARSLRIVDSKSATVTPLFSSPADAMATDSLGAEGKEIDLSKLPKGPFVMAVAGTLNTSSPPQAADAAKPADAKAPPAGRFVVVGNSRWAQNGSLGQYENRNLLANSINWLAAEEDLISIPPKSPSEATLVLTPLQLRILNLSAIFLIPLLVVAAGVLVWLRRR